MTREEAIEILKPFKACMFDQHGCPISDVAIALDVAIEALTERKTGKWMICAKADKFNRMIDEYELVCSQCRYLVANVRSHKDIPRFCGRCGAKMEI